jgi:hypothetical protein
MNNSYVIICNYLSKNKLIAVPNFYLLLSIKKRPFNLLFIKIINIKKKVFI